MEIVETGLPGVKLITPRRFGDARGWFAETWSRQGLAGTGIDHDFVQDNQSLSRPAGTVRGLHFQLAPFAQAKLVRVLRGAILDVAVDLRRGSPTYGRSVAERLDAEDGRQMYIPVGFAHGFCTLEPDSEVFYKVSAPYSAPHDRGLAWDDPALAIAWPVTAEQAVLSDKDRKQPRLADLDPPF